MNRKLPIEQIEGFLYKTANLSSSLKTPLALLIRKKKFYDAYKEITDPKKTYWICPERINFLTNFRNEPIEKGTYGNRDCNERMRGKIIGGDWDKNTPSFTDLEIFKRIKHEIENNKELRKTNYFKLIQSNAKSPEDFFGASNTRYLQQLFDCLSSKRLFRGNELGNLNQSTAFRGHYISTIDVSIGRNGDYLFQNNAYLLSVAKVFETKLVPVRIFVRHKKWQELRNFVISYLQNDDAAGLLYQPILHPDFLGIPIKPDNKCQETYDAIKSHLTKKNGIMLDIGANMGFFCHKFEDLGYQCYAIENDPNTFKILKRIRDAENKRFVVSRESIFETDVAKKIHFDLVLALNILHHFLKTKKLFYNLKKLLKVLDTDKMFFSAAHFREEQMRNAYQNYSEPRFVEFILKHTTLSKSEKILVGRGGRQVYKLSK